MAPLDSEVRDIPFEICNALLKATAGHLFFKNIHFFLIQKKIKISEYEQ